MVQKKGGSEIFWGLKGTGTPKNFLDKNRLHQLMPLISVCERVPNASGYAHRRIRAPVQRPGPKYFLRGSGAPGCPTHTGGGGEALNFFFFFQVGVCGQDFRSVGLTNWYLPLKRGACELKISKFRGLWTENFQILELES